MKTIGTFCDHGAAFAGPPSGSRCSDDKHRLLLFGKVQRAGELPETFEHAFARALQYIVVIDGDALCACCRYPIKYLTTSNSIEEDS